MTMPSAETVSAWARLLRAQAKGMASVQRALADADLPPLEWYDVLLEVERGGPLRPRDLQPKLLLAQYNLSRLLDRMVLANALERRDCQDDRRGHLVAITPAGKALRRRMWRVYGRAIEATIGSKLQNDEVGQLSALLASLIR